MQIVVGHNVWICLRYIYKLLVPSREIKYIEINHILMLSHHSTYTMSLKRYRNRLVIYRQLLRPKTALKIGRGVVRLLQRAEW